MSLCVLVRLPAHLAVQWPTPDVKGLPPHVTVLYVADESVSADPEPLLQVFRDVAAAKPSPLRLSLGAVEHFDNPGDTCAMVRVQGDGLASLRTGLLAEMAARGMAAAQRHPEFKPHATLAYLAPGERWTGVAPGGEAEIREVEVWASGGLVEVLPIGPRQPLRSGAAMLGAGRTPTVPVTASRLAHVRWVELRADALQAFIAGREVAALVEGPVYSLAGPLVGHFSRDDLREIARVFGTLRHRVPIDWEHSSTKALMGGEAVGPEEGGIALGEIAAMRVDESVTPARLMVTPLWTEYGLGVVRKAGGVLWFSPTLLSGRPVDRRTQESLGPHLPIAFACTVHPAQRPDLLDRVVEYSLRINQDGPGGPAKEDPMPMPGEEGAAAGGQEGDVAAELERLRAHNAELQQQLAEQQQQLAEALAKIAALEGAGAPAPAAEPAAMVEMRTRLAELSAQHRTTAAQVKVLSAQNEALALQADLERQRATNAHRERALDALVAEGKASPAERRLAGYDHDAEVRELSAALQKGGARAEQLPGTLDELHAEAGRRGVKVDTLSLHFTKEWRGRAPGEVVPLGARLGHGGAVVDQSGETVIKKFTATLRERAAKNGTSFKVELGKERDQNTPEYQAFCKARGGAA